MYTIEEIEPLTQLFAEEFPKFYHFVTKEIQILEFAADLALCFKDEDSCKNLNQEANNLSTALQKLTQRYTMDLFE